MKQMYSLRNKTRIVGSESLTGEHMFFLSTLIIGVAKEAASCVLGHKSTEESQTSLPFKLVHPSQLRPGLGSIVA